MSFAFLLLGKTNVAFFDAGTLDPTTPPAGVLGVIDAIDDFIFRDDILNPPLLTADASVSEGHSLQAKISEHEVESGANVTDNIRNLPRTLTIEGIVTDTPSGILALAVVPGLVDRFAGVPKSVEAFQKFEELHANKTILDVQTGLKIYQSMAIASVDFPKSAQVGRALQFNISLREVRFVSSATGSSTSLDGAGTANGGDVVPVPPSP